jgi:hypothetical protein
MTEQEVKYELMFINKKLIATRDLIHNPATDEHILNNLLFNERITLHQQRAELTRK